MSDIQPRTANGQFSEKEGSAPEIDLSPFGDASFEYPPAQYTNAEQVIQFWEKVPVPTSALDAMRTSYTLARSRFVRAGAEDYATALYQAYPDWRALQERDPAAWLAKLEDAQEKGAAARQQYWDEHFEPTIARHEARDVSRAIQMWYYAELSGSPEEAAKVRAHQVNIGGVPMTVEQVRDRYAFCADVGFDETSFEPYDTRVLAEIEALREDIRDRAETDEFFAFLQEREERIAQRNG